MRNILLIKHGSLGDIISSTSAIKSLRDHYKESSITIMTSKNYIPFFQKSKLCDNTILDNRKGFFNSLMLIFKIIKNNYDLIIDLQNSNRTSIYCLIIKCFCKIKVNGTHRFSDYRFVYDNKNPPHVIEGLCKQIELLGVKTFKEPFLSWLKDDNLKFDDLENKKFFIINPGCSKNNLVKRWSANKFADVCKYLITKDIIPVIIGTNEDLDTINIIEKQEKNILNLCNKSPLNVIYNLSTKAEGALSNDTGPAHLIAATNCKIHLILSSFSNTKTVIPQSKNVTYTQSNSIEDIPANKIIDGIDLLLQNEN